MLLAMLLAFCGFAIFAGLIASLRPSPEKRARAQFNRNIARLAARDTPPYRQW